MRHKNLLPLVNPRTKKPDWSRRLQAILKYGWRWYREYKAQEWLARELAKRLDARYILIRNAQLPGWEYPWPPVLVGPAGVYVVYTTPKRGLFRVREDVWEELHSRSRSFRPTRPNLVRQTLGLSRVLGEYLGKALGREIAVHPVLLFTDPSAMVDVARPAVRVVLADGLDHWLNQVTRQPEVLGSDTVERVVDALTPRPQQRAAERPSRRSATRRARAPRRQPGPLERYLNFTPKQWLILGVLAGLSILMLVFFIFLIVALNTP